MEYCQATDLRWCFIALKTGACHQTSGMLQELQREPNATNDLHFFITLNFTFTSKDARETWGKLKLSLLYMAYKPSSDNMEGDNRILELARNLEIISSGSCE